MVLNGIKRKTRNKNATQTNGNYKIRQIITKITEYTQYIYTHKQNKNSAKKNVQWIDPANKGNQK